MWLRVNDPQGNQMDMIFESISGVKLYVWALADRDKAYVRHQHPLADKPIDIRSGTVEFCREYFENEIVKKHMGDQVDTSKLEKQLVDAEKEIKRLNKLIEEEAHAGWVMLEKLDDSRIRFKRPRRARAQDAYPPDGVDPYRTHYGSPARYTMMVLLMVGATLLLVLGILAFVVASR